MKLRIGLVGTGYINGVHADAIAKTGLADVVAVASRTAEGAARFVAEKAPAARVYPDFNDMLREARLDAAFVSIPPDAHTGQVEAIAQAGIAVLVEKPIGLSSAQARAMVEAVEKTGVVAHVGFHMRYLNCVERLQQLIASGEAGRPTLYDGRFWTKMDGFPWWRDRTRSGGQVFEQVIHQFDLAAYLFGPVDSVTGSSKRLAKPATAGDTIDDTSAALLTFENGALGVITGSNTAIPVHFMNDFRAVFTGVTAHVQSTGQPWVTPDTCTLAFDQTRRETITEDGAHYVRQAAEFLNAVATQGRTRAPLREGLRAVELVEKIPFVA
ncbi:Gfo/Idh/MocA family protein [Nibricoccus sp. IMCC34717]|uniref:Gfo/Idh/MocA family protein n=1 Tax=Nibricoccus sp. IMCC34717 TaxID=3034021 RepID=UPI00384E12A3